MIAPVFTNPYQETHMINVRFTESYQEEGPQGAAIVVLAGTWGEIIGSSFFSLISEDDLVNRTLIMCVSW